MKIQHLKNREIEENDSKRKGITKHNSKSKNKKIKPTVKKCIENENRLTKLDVNPHSKVIPESFSHFEDLEIIVKIITKTNART